MPQHDLETDVLERFGDDNFTWVVVWGDLVALQNYMMQHENISLQELNRGIAAASYMSYMAKSDRTAHFKRTRDALKDFRTNLYPHAWITQLSNVADKTLELLIAPFNWLNNIFSETIIEIATEATIPEIARIDAATDALDELQIPPFSKEIDIIKPLLANLKQYFQERLNNLDSIIVAVQTEQEKEYELQKRFDLIKEWDNIVIPLQESNAIVFCENVQQYLQKNKLVNEDESMVAYPNMDAKKELLFNAPQIKKLTMIHY